jgi:hypothetical protein
MTRELAARNFCFPLFNFGQGIQYKSLEYYIIIDMGKRSYFWVTSKVIQYIRRVTDLKTGAAAGSPIGMTRQGARHVRNIYVLSDKSVGILVNAHGHA